jgi:hypothetical protein
MNLLATNLKSRAVIAIFVNGFYSTMERRVMLIVENPQSFMSVYNASDVYVSEEKADSEYFMCATIASNMVPLLHLDKNIVRFRVSSSLRML